MTGRTIDLDGQIFGKLTVIRRVRRVKHGRNNVSVWLCRCLCGNELEVTQTDLRKGLKPSCRACRHDPCIICGVPILNTDIEAKQNTCSDECQHEQLKKKHKRRYEKITKEDPDYNKKRHAYRMINDDNYRNKRIAK